MIRNLRLIAIATALLFTAVGFSQDLRIPNTPAFSILDHEPAAVMRPTSGKKLSADLINSFDKEGKLIMNYGLEVTPYWLKSRPNLTRKEYLHPGFLQTIKQTFTLSAATVKDTVTGNNTMGVGFRCQLVKALLPFDFDAAQKRIDALEKIYNGITAVRENAEGTPSKEEVIALIEAELQGEITSSEIDQVKTKALSMNYISVTQFCDALRNTYDQERVSTAKKVIELENTRIGFSLEMAAASKFVNTEGDPAYQKFGGWLNANYYVSENDAWTATLRAMSTKTDSTATHVDLGLSYIRIEKQYSIALEALLRYNWTETPDTNQSGQAIMRLDKSSTYRISAQMSYAVSEDISCNFSIGKAFDDPQISGSGFFSLFGLSYAVFNRQEFGK